jgi:hypothetical protein
MSNALVLWAALVSVNTRLKSASTVRGVCSLIIFFSSCFANAGEVDALEHMNALLANKPYVTYTRNEVQMKYMPMIGNVPVPHRVPFQAPAKVTNSFVSQVNTLKFDNAKLASLPELSLFTQKRLLNCADASISSSVSLALTGTRSWSVSKTDGVSTTTSASATGSLSVDKVGSAGLSISWSQAISTSTTKQESVQEAVTRTMGDVVSVGPKKAVNVSFVAYQVTIEIPFSATVEVDGDLATNEGGLLKASALLSKQERTIPLNGSLRVVDVSNATVRTDDLAGQAGCDGKDGKYFEEGGQQAIFKSAALGDQLKAGFAALNKASHNASASEAQAQASALMAAPVAEIPEIGPPDGTSYQILYTTETAKPTPACGFNDLGLMNTGIFTVEARQYRTYAKGILTEQHEESFEVFKSCFTP